MATETGEWPEVSDVFGPNATVEVAQLMGLERIGEPAWIRHVGRQITVGGHDVMGDNGSPYARSSFDYSAETRKTV